MTSSSTKGDEVQCGGASAYADRATAVEPVPVSPLRDGIPSAVLCEWLRGGEALDEVLPILVRIEDLENTPYGQIAQPLLDQLAYMIENRPNLIAQAVEARRAA